MIAAPVPLGATERPQAVHLGVAQQRILSELAGAPARWFTIAELAVACELTQRRCRAVVDSLERRELVYTTRGELVYTTRGEIGRSGVGEYGPGLGGMPRYGRHVRDLRAFALDARTAWDRGFTPAAKLPWLLDVERKAAAS